MAQSRPPDINQHHFDEEDVCRVCRVEADQDETLIHPCKCSGSVRFVHPNCLKSWLAHSQKRFCEICGHRYTFTKVYTDQLPSAIPLHVYVRQSAIWISHLLEQVARFSLVVVAWLVVVPFSNMTTLRSLLWFADSAALANTDTAAVGASISASSLPLIRWLSLHIQSFGQVDVLFNFVFRGQILSIALAAVIFGLVLARDWLAHHIWTEQTNPRREEPEIDSNDWIIRGGVAYKISDIQMRAYLQQEDIGGPSDRTPNERLGHEALGEMTLVHRSPTQSGSPELPPSPSSAPRPNVLPVADAAFTAPELLGPTVVAQQPLDEEHFDPPVLNGPPFETGIEDDEDNWEDVPDERPPIVVDRQVLLIGHEVVPQPELVDQLPGQLEEADWDREDWMGILEAVGFVGPLRNLFQNALFAIVLMSAATVVLVGSPIVIGKVVLSLDPVRWLAEGVRLVFRLVQAVTDPVVDVVIEIVREVFLSPADNTAEAATASYLWVDSQGSLFDLLEASRGQSSSVWNILQTALTYTAQTDSTFDRAVCLIVGYATTGGIIALLMVMSPLSGGLVGQIVQHSVFLKLAFFMVLEMAVFPTFAGSVVLFSLSPLFGHSFSTQRTHIQVSPLKTLLVNWVVGTSFTYAFSAVLSLIRKTLRPGALYMFRDPEDESFSPVKEIVETPTVLQLRKLFSAVLTYFTIIFLLFGVSVGIVSRTSSILPLRSNTTPITSVPFDILACHLAISPAWAYDRWRHRLSRLWSLSWRSAICAFGLSSLLYGDPQEKEQKSPLDFLWPMLDPIFQLRRKYNSDATPARAPASDRVALLPPSERSKDGVFVPLDASGSPTTEKGKLTLLKQDRLARQSSRDPKTDYQVIFLPRYWQVRVYVFVFFVIGAMASTLACAFFGPIIVGRSAISMVWQQPVHDGHSYVAGMSICLLAADIGQRIGRQIARSGHAGFARASDSAIRLKRSLLWFACGSYAVFMLYMVLPSVVGIVFELFVSIPARYAFDKSVIPVVHFWDAWSHGSILVPLIAKAADSYMRRAYPEASPTRVQRIGELRREPLKLTFNEVNSAVLPVVLSLTLWMLFPMIPGSAVVTIRPGLRPARAGIFRMMYPLTLLFLMTVAFRGPATRRLLAVRQKIFDAEYVVDEQVDNYEPVVESEDKSKEGEQGGERRGEEGEGEGNNSEWEDEEEVVA